MCDHLDKLTKDNIIPKSNFAKFECEECVKVRGNWWVNLRICQTCGKMLCCESSPNQHMLKHFNETGHPVITSAELGDNWAWCYIDEEERNPAISS
jgi:uncharacterized UBP type Zn finger protein